MRNTMEIVWILRLNTLIPNGLKILDWGAKFKSNQRVQQNGTNIIYLTDLDFLE